MADVAQADAVPVAADAAQPVFLVSLPNSVMLPTIIASTPRSLPILAALVGSARLELEKFCSAMILSRCLRSMIE